MWFNWTWVHFWGNFIFGKGKAVLEIYLLLWVLHRIDVTKRAIWILSGIVWTELRNFTRISRNWARKHPQIINHRWKILSIQTKGQQLQEFDQKLYGKIRRLYPQFILMVCSYESPEENHAESWKYWCMKWHSTN